MTLQAPIHCLLGRMGLPIILNELRLTGEAVEVGTHRGEYASCFLEKWNGRMLWCVDPWENPAGYEQQALTLAYSDGNRNNDYAACLKALRKVDPRGKRHNLLKLVSLEAATVFKDGSLDLVYIDGDHTRPAIDNDLEAWWPKLKKGGLLAGHDFICPNEFKGGWGQHIQPAVMKFAFEQEVSVYLLAEMDNSPWSYYMVRP